jgi:hypothetical protein
VYKSKFTPEKIADKSDRSEAAIHEALAFYHVNSAYFAQLEDEEVQRPPYDGRSDQEITENASSPADDHADGCSHTVESVDFDSSADSDLHRQ